MKVIKKDGTLEAFDSQKIINAVDKSANRVMIKLSDEQHNRIIDHVINLLREKGYLENGYIPIAEMHCVVEQTLDGIDPEIAKSYRDYRNYKKDFVHMMDEVYTRSQSIRYIGDKENSNSDSALVATKRCLIFNELNKRLYRKFFMTKEELQACKDGYIYIHDQSARLDTMNCCLFDASAVMKDGFEMGNVWYNEPKTLDTAFDVLGDIILATAAQQYGGFTVPEVDKILAPYAVKSFHKYKDEYMAIKPDKQEARDYAMKKVERDFGQGFQGIEMKLNTVGSSRGDYPFITMTFGLATDTFGKMASKTFLRVHMNGQGKEGNKKPVLFPKLVFLYDESIHGVGGVNEDVFEAGIECSSKTMYPDWLSLTGEGYVPEMYKKYGAVVSPMGCVDGAEIVTYLYNGDLYVEPFKQMWERLEYSEGSYSSYDNENSSAYIDTAEVNLKIWDTKSGFTKVSRVIRNWSSDWRRVTIDDKTVLVTADHPFETENRGVVHADDLKIGDQIVVGVAQGNPPTREYNVDSRMAYRQGYEIYDASSYDNKEIIPNVVFSYDKRARVHFLAALAYWYGVNSDGEFLFELCDNKSFALQIEALAKSCGMRTQFKTEKSNDETMYKIIVYPTYAFINALEEPAMGRGLIPFPEDECDGTDWYIGTVESVEIESRTMPSYDVTTESEHFEFSGIYSHNCRAFLSPWYERGGAEPADENDRPVFVGRFNIGAVALHLPMILAKARQENKDFYEVLDYYLEMIRGIHKRTYDYLGEMKASTNPVAFCEGGFYGGRLKPSDKIKPLLKPMTASFGITALNELQELYNGKSLVEDGEFALEVMRHINDKVAEFKKEDGWLYAIYSVPGENLCFTGDTEVKTINGSKKIKDVEAGDIVYSYNEETDSVWLDKVVAKKLTGTNEFVLKITLDNGYNFKCTPNHKIAIKFPVGAFRWIYARNLVHGDRLVIDRSESLRLFGEIVEPRVESVTVCGEREDVYDIEVQTNHNFFIGGADNVGILVHNCGLQIEQFRKKYGIVENVSDRPYVSNSFHCHVTEDITPIEKQDLEGRFWNLSNGGKIQYVRYPISYNKDAIRTLVRRAMAKGFYEGVNLSLAYCDDCGHQELEMDVCPVCGSKNLTKIDRMNGYLSYSRVHGDTRLNAAKMAEIAERRSM